MRVFCEANIEHNEDTIKTLFKAKSHVYGKRRILIRMIIGACLVIAGLVLNVTYMVQAALLMIGAWLLVSRDFASTQKAEEVLKVRGGTLPKIEYRFCETYFELQDGKKKKINYNELERLVEDGQYFYLFENSNSICMINKKTVKGLSLEDFVEHLETRSEKTFEADKSFLNMNLRDILRLLKTH